MSTDTTYIIRHARSQPAALLVCGACAEIGRCVQEHHTVPQQAWRCSLRQRCHGQPGPHHEHGHSLNEPKKPYDSEPILTVLIS